MINSELLYNLINAHMNLMIEENISDTPAVYSEENNIYRTAKLAFLKLGFIEKDAEVLGLAWKNMSDRLGKINENNWPIDIGDFRTEPFKVSKAFPRCEQDMNLYVMAPNANWVKKLVDMDVPTVQLRFKSENQAEIEKEIIAAIQYTNQSNTKLFINDYWQLAVRHNAYGVHLGQEDLGHLSDDDLKTLHQSGLRLGISTHGYAEMIHAHRYRPSYLALGAIFPTTLKKMPTSPQGIHRFKKYAQLMSPHYPVVAIGGIDLRNISLILSPHVSAVGIVRAVINAPEPQIAVNDFKKILKTRFL